MEPRLPALACDTCRRIVYAVYPESVLGEPCASIQCPGELVAAPAHDLIGYGPRLNPSLADGAETQ